MARISSARKPLLLYVEDSEQQRQATAELLEDDFEVIEAGSAETGLALADRYGQRVDIALVDRMMPQPGMQGDQLAQILAERGHRVVMLSAKKGTHHRKELLGPAIVYLEKPIDPDELTAQLQVIARLRFADQVAAAMNALAVAASHTAGTIGNGLSAAAYIDLNRVPEDQRPYVAALCGAATAMRKALEQLSTFSRLRLRGVVPEPQKIRLGSLLKQCLLGLETDLAVRGVVLADGVGGASLWADLSLLRITLDGILTHAAAAADRNSAISVKMTDAEAVTIAYAGAGFTPQVIDRLFEPAPADPYKHQERDFGLGWVNAAMAMSAQGGDLTVESDGIDAGARITLRLPQP